MFELSCVAHVHTTYSDGTATVPEVVAAARRNGADALLVTDHDTLAAKRDGWEGWHDGVLVLVGHEISPTGGHFLAFGTEDEIAHAGRTETEICTAVEAAGGFGFAAHPFSEGSRMSRLIGRPHPWRAIADCRAAGIELWSLVTDSAEAWRTPWEAVAFLRHPERAADGPPPRHMQLWDDLCRSRRVPAIGGLDAHQSGLRIRGRVLSPMPHDRYFGLLQTHLLLRERATGGLARDRFLVYDALREGRCFLALDGIAPARGFRFEARSGGRTVSMGEQAPAGRWTLEAGLPASALVRVLRDGTPIAEVADRHLRLTADQPGAYRLEAFREHGGRMRTWIASNPIYLRGDAPR